MDMGNVIKWLDDLQSQIDRLTRKVGNGGGTPPTPTPANPLVLLANGTTDDVTMLLSQDGTSAWTQNGAKLKSGGGTFVSYVMSDGAEIDPVNYSHVSIAMTFQSATPSGDIPIVDLNLTAGVKYEFGCYYKSTSQGCEVGLCYAPSTRPQDIQLWDIATGTGASGDIYATTLSLFKNTNNRRAKK